LACTEAYGTATTASIVSLRELLGLIGAHEWRKKGVLISALSQQLEARIHPHYGVFSPVRGEYLELVANAPLPSAKIAFDIGTGTGVLSALLAKRGVERIIATDQDPRAIACAKENLERLGFIHQVELLQTNMFPPGKASLIICNPPWIPARPSSPIEHAIYDPESKMLIAFLNGLSAHLEEKGEGWLIISDIAEHLGLRTREQLLNLIAKANLQIIDRLDIQPKHSKVFDVNDALHAARSKEVTSLWRLAHKS
jgi:methylase of polypeptide subunit release factors